MSRLHALGEGDREDWESLLRSVPGTGFMQSWAWSEFKEAEGYEVLRLGLFRGGRLSGGAIAYAYSSPAEGGLIAVPDGPVLDWTSPAAAEDLGSLIAELRRWPRAKDAVLARLEPRLESAPPALAGLPRSPVDLVPEETLEVLLGREEEMLARMKPKGRYNARLALRHGVRVEFSQEPAAASELYFLLERTGAYHGFLVEPKSFFINLASTLPRGMFRFAFARYKGMTLAAALVLRHGEQATYLYGAHLPLFPELMAAYALHWEVMRRAAAEGCRTYDLYGFVPRGFPGHPYDRFSRFKEKLGGRGVRRMGSRDVFFYDRLADAALRAMSSARRA